MYLGHFLTGLANHKNLSIIRVVERKSLSPEKRRMEICEDSQGSLWAAGCFMLKA